MRFLVVYQDFSRPAKELLERLAVDDVTILPARKGEQVAGAEVVAELQRHPCAPAAVCQVVRKYRKSIERLLDVQYVAKKFRADDQQLRAWLCPGDAVKETYVKPSRAIKEASDRAVHLLVANGALDHADDVASRRWRFVNRSAVLLARYANGEDLGPLREWRHRHGVDFATNGQVRYTYVVKGGGAPVEGSTEWHLKEGDHTTRESAARIYFERVDVGGVVKICVFYVGPHPQEGAYFVCVDCDD